MQQKLKTLLLLLALALSPAFARGASTAPVVLGISYACADPVIHINSAVTVYMSAIVPSPAQSFSVSVTASTASTITLDGATLGTLGSTTLYVTDGVRAWAVPFPGSVTSISFGDAQLLVNSPPFNGINYTTISNNSFRVYTGTLVTGSMGGSPTLSVDIGNFDNLALADQGISGDAIADDGIWTGIYNVRDLGFAVYNGKFFGIAIVNGQVTNPFQSIVSFSLDGVRPSIDYFTFKTSNPLYNGIMYLARHTQGSPTFDPTNNQGRFDVVVNKLGTIVDIVIQSPTPKQLPPLYFPSNALNLNGFKVWSGDDGVGNYVADGFYAAKIYVRDSNGVEGITKTVQVGVISMRMRIENAQVSPATISVAQMDPNNPADNLTLSYRAILDTDTPGAPLISSLAVLGFGGGYYGPGSVTTPDGTFFTCITCTVISQPQWEMLNPDGTVGLAYRGHDVWTSDTDLDMLYRFLGDSSTLVVGDCWHNLTPGAMSTTSSAGAVVNLPDGDAANDWDVVFSGSDPRFGTPGFQPDSAANPTVMTFNFSEGLRLITNSPGSFRVRMRSLLAGWKAVTPTNPATQADVGDFCQGLSLSNPVMKYRSWLVHFEPDLVRGGILAEDDSVLFTVTSDPPVTSDTTSPLIISSDPQDVTRFGPGAFGPLHPMTVQVQDPETPINIANGTSFIKVVDPAGSFVAGNATSNGGGLNNTATLSFTPFSPLTTGGDYIMQVSVCNQAGLCKQKNITFTIQDQTAPGVSAVELLSTASTSTIPLTMFQTGPDGTFSNITAIWATLSMPTTSTNTIVWDQSTIELVQISGSATVNIPLKRLTPPGTVPSDGKLKYALSSTLNTAGLFEVKITTFAKDGSGTTFTGPPVGFVNPQFNTLVNPNTLAINYPFPNPLFGFKEAVSGTQPITVTVGVTSFQPTTNNTQVVLPNFAALPANSGFQALTASALNAYALQFNFNGAGATTVPGTWNYGSGNPLRFTLHYNDADLPLGILNSSLKLYGYTGGTWQTVASGFQHSYTNVTDNTFVIDAPNGSAAYSVYAIFYSALSGNVTPPPTPTPNPFKATRSFNPTHSNPIYRKAKFYYSDTAPKDIEVKIYDTAGGLVRTLTLGAGVNLADVDTDPVYGKSAYFFTWDGANDSLNLVKNGIYLVRWRVTKQNGEIDTQTKAVALIK